MSYFGYNLDTNRGWIPAFTTEDNVPVDLPASSFISIHTPSPDTLASKRFMLVSPIAGSPNLKDSDIPREVVEDKVGTVIGKSNTGMPIIMGKVIDEADVPRGATVTRVPMEIYGHSPFPVWAIVILVVVVALTLNSITMYLTDYFKVQEVERSRRHENDTALQLMEETDRREFDLNNDGIMDVEEITWGNGEVLRSPISDYGVSVIGVNPITVKEGLDMDALLALWDKREDERRASQWIGDAIKAVAVVAGVGIGGYFTVKGVGEISKWRAEQRALKATSS